MLYYPQLQSGSAGQFPLIRQRIERTVVNTVPDGSTWRYGDPNAAASSWTLAYSALNAAELTALQNLFAATEGSLQPFTFLDPAGNLFAWSEDFSQSQWKIGPLLQITTGAGDPFGTTRAASVVNAAQASQRISQVLNAPGWFQYAVSAYVKSAAPTSVRVVRSSTSASDNRTFGVGTGWTRLVSAGALTTTDTTFECGIEMDAGVSVTIFGLQAEAQPAASVYKRSGATGGVYAAARFDQDALETTAIGPNLSDVTVKIRSSNGD
jgi:hypothetical protein